jgi:hypothetical protein
MAKSIPSFRKATQLLATELAVWIWDNWDVVYGLTYDQSARLAEAEFKKKEIDEKVRGVYIGNLFRSMGGRKYPGSEAGRTPGAAPAERPAEMPAIVAQARHALGLNPEVAPAVPETQVAGPAPDSGTPRFQLVFLTDWQGRRLSRLIEDFGPGWVQRKLPDTEIAVLAARVLGYPEISADHIRASYEVLGLILPPQGPARRDGLARLDDARLEGRLQRIEKVLEILARDLDSHFMQEAVAAGVGRVTLTAVRFLCTELTGTPSPVTAAPETTDEK